jgi:Fe-S cluster assembly protein SufD
MSTQAAEVFSGTGAAAQTVGLLEKLGAAAGVTLPTAQTESFKYTSLRALNSKAKQLVSCGLMLVPAQFLREAAQIPDAKAPSRLTSTGFFAPLAAKGPSFAATLSAHSYFQIAPALEKGLVQQSHLLEVPTHASATLIWHHCGEQAESLVNLLTQIQVGENANLTLIRVQNAHSSANVFERTEIFLAPSSNVSVFDINLGAQLSRHELVLNLQHRDAAASVLATSCLDGRQHHDLQLSLLHETVHTTSNTRIKTITKDRSRAVINGRIFVAKGADFTDAKLKTQNLLLSADAEIDAKPELEIYADEVVCAHGATIGQLDDQALFYLKSRGLDDASARSLLTYAFAAEILTQIDNEAVREQLIALLKTKLS